MPKPPTTFQRGCWYQTEQEATPAYVHGEDAIGNLVGEVAGRHALWRKTGKAGIPDQPNLVVPPLLLEPPSISDIQVIACITLSFTVKTNTLIDAEERVHQMLEQQHAVKISWTTPQEASLASHYDVDEVVAGIPVCLPGFSQKASPTHVAHENTSFAQGSM